MIKQGETYIIGEIGQNHNGSVDIAKLIVELIARPIHEDVFGLNLKPMDAVKMTRRDLNEELTISQMNRPYVNKNSFGATYGEHRAFLELDDHAHYEVFRYAKEKGLDFVEKTKGIEAIFVDKDNKVYVTKNLANRFELDKSAHYKLGNLSDLK